MTKVTLPAMVLVAVLLLASANLAVGEVTGVGSVEDWNIPGGHFFSQTGGGGGKGYAVTDDVDIKFWSEFQRLGGVQAVGYPISGRFEWGGFTVQAFQRVILQWRPDEQQAYFVNIFDVLSERGKDDWLLSTRQTPKPSQWNEAGLSWNEIVKMRLAVLDGYPDIARMYYSVPGDPVAMNGLPVAEVADLGTALVLRAQRVVIQQWKEDVPWAVKGQVTVANGGDLGAEAGLYPPQATVAQAPKYDPDGRLINVNSPEPVVTPTKAAVASSPPGKIVFTSNRDSWDDVFIMNADGSHPKRLTAQSRSYAGALSPDGTKVVFDVALSPDKKSNYQIFVLNSDGTGMKRLTDNVEDWYPAWSPDGSRIAYFSYRGGKWEIWTMNADGTNQRRLVPDVTHIPRSPVTWSSKGTIIWGDDIRLWIAREDGADRRGLGLYGPTTSSYGPAPVYRMFPAYSPDGNRIAVASYYPPGRNFQIWVANGDGNGARMLTSQGENLWPTWSPDGTHIAFSSYRDGNWEIYTMNVDGTNQVNLTNSPGDDKAPHWSR